MLSCGSLPTCLAISFTVKELRFNLVSLRSGYCQTSCCLSIFTCSTLALAN